MYLQVADRCTDLRTQSDLHVTHVAKLVTTVKYGLPEYSGAGHVMSDEHSTRRKVVTVAACRVSRITIGRQRTFAANRAPCVISSIRCRDCQLVIASRINLAHSFVT